MSARWTEPGRKPYGWLLLLALPLLIWLLLRPRGIAVEVVAKTWRREVDIERRAAEMFSEECARMPTGAELLDRRLRDGVEHCRFRAAAWRRWRLALAQGQAPHAPHWPDLQLQAAEGDRAGARRERLELLLRDDDGRSWSCQLAAPAWRAWAIGDQTRLAVHRFSGVANCASLPPAPR